jgi:hypothetical protein
MRSQELAFTVVLGVLAVLPIRQVTVPSDLQGLTRIDLLLSLGVTSAVGVLLVALSAQLLSRPNSPAVSEETVGSGRHPDSGVSGGV